MAIRQIEDTIGYRGYCKLWEQRVFIDVYEDYRKKYNAIHIYSPIVFNDGLINDSALDGTSFNAVCPNLCGALRLAFGDATFDYFDDEWLLDFSEFHISPKFAKDFGYYACSYSGDWDDNPQNWSFPITCTGYEKIFLRMLERVEREQGLQLLAMATALFNSYDPQEFMMNKYENEKYTPKAKQTITTKDNFKTTTTSKFKSETDNNTYGFNSSSPVPTGGSETSGLSTDNENVTSGVEADNHSSVETSYDGAYDEWERKGMNQNIQDALKKEIEIRRIEFMKAFKEALRKEMFVI